MPSTACSPMERSSPLSPGSAGPRSSSDEARLGRANSSDSRLASSSLLIVASASGLLLLLTGSRPSESLHLLYAGVAVAVIPLARSFLGRASRRRAGLLFLVAFVVLGAVVYRLFTTG